jgi:CBS domain-containing protein
MDKGNEFIEYFNKIESHLRKITKSDYSVPFSELLLKTNNFIIRNNLDTLRQIGRLRNAISHTRGSKIYADPTDLSINIVKKISEKLLSPKKLYNIIKNVPIVVDENDSFTHALEVINNNRISQFPVFFNKKYSGLLSSNSITLWLADNIESDEIIMDLSKVKISDILNYNESLDEARFIPKKTDVIEFAQLIKDNNEVSVWFITENGKKDESILRVITAYDYELIFAETTIN